MNIFTMRRFWLAVSLPALIALFTGKSGLILTGVAWMPVSALLLIWAFFTYQREKKEEAELVRTNMLNLQKEKMALPKEGSNHMNIINFFKMKRVWIAFAIPMIIIYNYGIGGQSIFWSAGLLWMPVSGILLFTALNSYSLKLGNSATADNFNENKDGIYSHKLHDTEMHLDSTKRVITLKNGNNKKTYSFDDIKEWEYHIISGGEIETSGLNPTANLINNKTLIENISGTGFFISVRDIKTPEWKIKFFPTEGSFKSIAGQNNLRKQMKQWMEVFDQIVNGNRV